VRAGTEVALAARPRIAGDAGCSRAELCTDRMTTALRSGVQFGNGFFVLLARHIPGVVTGYRLSRAIGRLCVHRALRWPYRSHAAVVHEAPHTIEVQPPFATLVGTL
jgi:hypothetical protein